jgi:hypothetical protein
MNCAAMKSSSRSAPAPAMKRDCDIKSNHDIKSTKSNHNIKSTKYCGVCHKAGKPATEYESHYTRSIPGPNGVITCPIILSAVCKSCGKSGHFSDHCNNISLPKKQFSNKVFIEHKSSVKNSNLFSALSDYDDMPMPITNIKKKIVVVNNEDIKKEIRNLAPNGVSFADMLMREKEPVKKNTHAIIATAVACQKMDSNTTAKVLFAEKILSRNRCSWLDSDSDDDMDDYDDDYDCDENDW